MRCRERERQEANSPRRRGGGSRGLECWRIRVYANARTQGEGPEMKLIHTHVTARLLALPAREIPLPASELLNSALYLSALVACIYSYSRHELCRVIVSDDCHCLTCAGAHYPSKRTKSLAPGRRLFRARRVKTWPPLLRWESDVLDWVDRVRGLV